MQTGRFRKVTGLCQLSSEWDMEQVTQAHPELEKTIRIPVLSTTAARQGETSGHVRVILASSLALAALVFLVVYGISVN